MSERWLTEVELCERTGLARATVQRWRRLGTGPAFAVLGARAVRYSEGEVARWLASRTVRSTAEGHALENEGDAR